MAHKEACLQRTIDIHGHQGGFGFSVLGGAGTKFPAVVCEVDTGGPAALSGKVNVGDQLVTVNGEELSKLSPKELVQKIRNAPSLSKFGLLEDEALREKVLGLIEKQKRPKKPNSMSSSEITMQIGPSETRHHSRKTSSHSITDIMTEKKGKKIEVEASVNINDGVAAATIIQIDGNVVRHVQHDADHGSPRQHATKAASLGGNHIGDPTADRQSLRAPSLSPEHRTGGGVGGGVAGGVASGGVDGVVGGVGVGVGVGGGGGRLATSPERRSVKVVPSTGSQEGGSVPEVPHISVEDGSKGRPEDGLTVDSLERFIRSSPHVEGRRNSRDVSAKRESRQSIESYKNETETTTTEVAIIGFEEKPIEHSSDSSTPRPSSDGSSHSESFQERPRSADISSAEVTRRSPKKKPQATHTSYVDAVGMARRLYMMDGYRKSEVAEKLADMSEFGKTVAKEYLKFFEFDHTPLDIALREFLTYFSLTGESQERERVIQHFSQRYHECNPTTFSSEDVVHGMTVALLLLNTDLHGTHDGERMTFNQFIRNLEGIDVKLPKETLKKFYDSIKSNALQWALDDEVEKEIGSSSSLLDPPEQTETVIMHHVTIPGTFVEVQLPSNALLFKEGYIRKKNIMEGPHKKVARGKRQWKAYHAVLKGFMLYFTAPQGELNLDDTSSAIAVTHCLAIRDPDYQRKEAVFRFTTPDWQAYLIQANSISEMLQWIGAINKSAATYSSPPLAAAVGSGNAAFHRPTFPLAPTKNTVEEQIACHESRVASLEKELQELESYKPDKKSHNAIQDWFDRREFVQFEINRFRIYLATLTNPQFVDFSAPLPSGLVPSPSISTLAAMGTGNSMSESFRTETPPPSLSPRTEHRKRPIVPMKK